MEQCRWRKTSLGVPLSKTEVYETVQAVAARVPGLKRERVLKASQDSGFGWGCNECEMCRAMAAFGSDRGQPLRTGLDHRRGLGRGCSDPQSLDRTHRGKRGSPGVSDR